MTCVVCGVVCGVPSCSCAPAVCYSKREPNIKEYWEQNSSGQRPKGVLDPVSACFSSVFFDKWASPGSLGDLSRLLALTRPPLGKAGIAADDFKIRFSLCFAATEASKRPFCALELPTVFRTRFRRPPGSILGAILASKSAFFGHLCWSLGSPCWS